MARKIEKQKIETENSSSLVVKLPKKLFVYALLLLIVVGLIYFVGKELLVASVNGQIINRVTVIRQLEKQGGKKAIEDIIVKNLINQEAKKRNISVSQDEVEIEISKIEKNVASQGTTVEALLKQQGMTRDDLIDQIKLPLLVTKMVDKNFIITDKEIEDYIASQKDLPSIGGTESATKITKDQAKEAIKQQKLQEKIQTFVADLKAKAKINYFIKY